ncbi:hypothetical protein BDY21DRAFT_348053 [Lineolata rhizophorae]|uniref:BTB domain-containing protein n=1 Tax=Lineolata rhizophorae TaxID=578093 RepID=A0A6A6NY17_9PEZI|nr:hypothetical protein BDY21DRAFT_348053 [Lineolata rhizophorae]
MHHLLQLRMGHWQDKLVYIRDFAYPNHAARRLRMESASSESGSVSIADIGPADFAMLVSGPVVDVYVGPLKRHWAVHRNLLRRHSDWLAAELPESDDENIINPTSKPEYDGDDEDDVPSPTVLKTPPAHTTTTTDATPNPNRLDLPADSPAGFELFVQWLYQGKLTDVSTLPLDRKYDHAVASHALYILCERLHIPSLMNAAMDQYRLALQQSQLVPDADEIADIVIIAPPGSPFRRLMARIAARQIMAPEEDRDAADYERAFEQAEGFAVEVVNAIRDGVGGKLLTDPTEGGGCEFHDHSEGPDCSGNVAVGSGGGVKAAGKGKGKAVWEGV